MRSDRPSKTKPQPASLLPVRGRWARYLLCLALVLGVYLALTAGLWLRPFGVYPPCGLNGAVALSLAVRSWKTMVDIHPQEAHRDGGLIGAITAGWLAALAAYFLSPGGIRGIGILFAALAFLLAVPLGALVGGAVWGSRIAARERRTGVSSSDHFD